MIHLSTGRKGDGQEGAVILRYVASSVVIYRSAAVVVQLLL